MAKYKTVSDVARKFDVSPHIISTLFYRRVLDDQRCPVIGGRRLIPADYVSKIGEVLRERGILKESCTDA